MDQTLYKIVGDKIRKIRNDKGLSQVDLAKHIDHTSASISNIENGEQRIQLADLYKLAEFFEVELSSLLPSLQELKASMPSIDKEIKKYPEAQALIDSLRKTMKEG
ncbi:MAG: helix-turn-helix transcriptional regulator [Deltaproteobacteria bacterium]|nr:helix-turn-helix transcriptional regulator [Deltaproteobacteria bacterium]